MTRYLRAACLVLALLVSVPQARAQSAKPPAPRTVEDILALLDQFKPDPAAIEAQRRILTAPSPSVTKESAAPSERQLWAAHHHRRARAYGQLGMLSQQIAELDTALEFSSVENEVREFDSLGLRPRVLNELMVAEVFGGSILNALRVAGQLADSGHFWALIGLGPMARMQAEMGNLVEARATMERADATLTALRSSTNWGIAQHNWNAVRNLGQGALLQAEGRLGDAEGVLRSRVEDADRATRAMAAVRAYSKLPPPPELMLQLAADAELQLSKNLALQGRIAEAESYARSALLKMLQGFGRYSTQSGQAITDLGSAVFESGRFRESAALARAAIKSYEVGGAAPETWYFALARALLGASLAAQGAWPEAIVAFEERERGLALDTAQYQRIGGAGDVYWGMALLQTGKIEQSRKMLEGIYRRYAARGLPENHPLTAQARGFYATSLAAAGERGAALAEFRGALPTLLEDSRRAASFEQGGAVDRQMRLGWILEAYLQLLHDMRDAPELKAAGIDAAAESFRIADIARGGSVQRALAESAARATPIDPALAALARREQEIEQQFVARSDLLNRVLSVPPARQDASAVKDLREELATLRERRTAVRRELLQGFPGYAELIAVQAPTVESVRQALQSGEAIISLFVGAQRTFVWALAADGRLAFNVVPLGEAAISARVAKLRQGVDASSGLIGRFPRFPVGEAHDLYVALLAPVLHVWKEAHTLFVVPHRPLAQLPFALLPTAHTAPDALRPGREMFEEYRQVPWLIRQAAIAQLPSVGAILSLRRLPPAPLGRRAFVGFGDPRFSAGRQAIPAPAGANVARNVVVRNLGIARVAGRSLEAAPAANFALPSFRVANSAGLGQLSPLPDTAEEVADIARSLGADFQADVFLGTAASETNAKAGHLDQRRIVMFATHGLVSGDLDGLEQPALALSAPELTGGNEDGLLTMSEVLELKMNADWVVLSACNTAAGEGEGGEALSGLGRAFFYAGARALLVSNWPVETVSARMLTTRLIAFQAAQPQASRAAALRATMLHLIDNGQPPGVDAGSGFTYAHPMFWAPFSLVGDGGR